MPSSSPRSRGRGFPSRCQRRAQRTRAGRAASCTCCSAMTMARRTEGSRRARPRRDPAWRSAPCSGQCAPPPRGAARDPGSSGRRSGSRPAPAVSPRPPGAARGANTQAARQARAPPAAMRTDTEAAVGPRAHAPWLKGGERLRGMESGQRCERSVRRRRPGSTRAADYCNRMLNDGRGSAQSDRRPPPVHAPTVGSVAADAYYSYVNCPRASAAGTWPARAGGTMGIMDFLKGELLEIIEWTDDSRDTLSFRFPDDDKAIKRGAQLIVRESQVAQFVYLGEFGDTFAPGQAHADDRQHPDPDEAASRGSTASSRRSRPTSTSSTRACSPATSGARPTRS